MKIHPAAELFPMMMDPELAGLAADIISNGLREPIALWQDQIIDGRNRFAACKIAKVEPKYQHVEGLADDAAVARYVASLNLNRRHLSTSQRAMIGAKLAPMFEEEAKQRQAETQIKDGRTPVSANLREPKKHSKATEEAARVVNVSARSVEEAKQVLTNAAPEIQRMVEDGSVSVHAASHVSRLPKGEQVQAAAEGRAKVKMAANAARVSPRIAKGIKTRKNNSAFKAVDQCISELGEIWDKPFSTFPLVKFRQIAKRMFEAWDSFKKGTEE